MNITVKYVNHPQKPDAKYGNIKTTDDQTIMVPVANLGQFQRGMSCELATEQRTWGSGAEARPVTIAVGLPGGRQAPAQGVQGYTGNQTNPGYQQGQAASPGPAPGQGNIVQLAPPPAQAASPGHGRGNPEARSIFATGVVGRAMGSGKFEASSMDMLLKEALRVYDLYLGPQAGGLPSDRIPF
jgi:hypothetical protein